MKQWHPLQSEADFAAKARQIVNLTRLVDLVECKLQALPPWRREDHLDGWARYRSALQKIADHLVEHEGARLTGSPFGDARFRMAKVSTSCTSGFEGLLKNWIVAARRKITTLEARKVDALEPEP